MRLNKATTHAIRMLVACARAEDELVKVSELASALELSQQNAFKIVHLLSRAGLVKATRGRYGGVALGRPAAAILVGEVVVAMEELSYERGAEGERAPGEDQLDLIDDAFAAFIAVLNATSIADMVKAERKPVQKARRPKKPAARALKTVRGREVRRSA